MHPYLPHLIEDITAAHRTEIPGEVNTAMSFEEEMEEIERWLEGIEPPHTFGYYCGLESVNFPPAYQLTNNEMKKVLAAFNRMMFTWNLSIDLPKTLPVPIAYTMTLDTLNAKTDIVNTGIMNFDFCSGYAPGCIFKEYCPCLEIWNSNEKMDDMDDKPESGNEDFTF